MNQEHIKQTTKVTWGTNPAGWTFGQGYTTGSKEFFESVLNNRFTYECDWFQDVIDFTRFNNKKVLEIGCGAGYDAYQFCKQKADYTGIDITPENIILTKKHLSYYNFDANILEMDAENLPFPESSFDYVFSFGVLHHTPNIEKALANIYHVLKPNGEAQIIIYNKHSVFYLLSVVLFDWILGFKFLKMSLKDRRSKIEFTTSNALPLVNVYSKKDICSLMKKSGLIIIKTDVRKLVREDLPYIPLIGRLYKYIPNSWLQIVGKKFGWYISVRAIKRGTHE